MRFLLEKIARCQKYPLGMNMTVRLAQLLFQAANFGIMLSLPIGLLILFLQSQAVFQA